MAIVFPEHFDLARIEKARVFSKAAHTAAGNIRKFTNTDYHHHPESVVAILMHVPGVTENMVIAAYLHDVLEDTKVKRRHIFEEFGFEVLQLVLGLTDISIAADGTREIRKMIDRAHLAGQNIDVKNIKVADLIHNGKDIVNKDAGFAKIFIPEMELVLEVMTEADPDLLKIALKIPKDYHSAIRNVEKQRKQKQEAAANVS